MEYTVSLASVLPVQDASQHYSRARPRLYYVSTVPAFCGGFATVLLAVHRFAVAASLGIRTATLPLEQQPQTLRSARRSGAFDADPIRLEARAARFQSAPLRTPSTQP